MAKDYYSDLMDSMRINSSSSIQTEHDRVKRIEEGRRAALLESEPFKQIERQTALTSQMVEKQNVVIDELKKQTEGLQTQVRMLESSEKEAKRKSKWSTIGFWITTAIAVASLVIAILAWALPR